jgi:GNAT superfamily N-acetyltransferase
MWVDPSARGHGLGGLLVDAAVQAWRGVGGVSIGLTCVESNAAAMHLYRSNGFQPTGRTWPMDDGRVEVELLRPL